MQTKWILGTLLDAHDLFPGLILPIKEKTANPTPHGQVAISVITSFETHAIKILAWWI
jgi:hypothetical protein